MRALLFMISTLVLSQTVSAQATVPRAVLLSGADLYTVSHGVIERGELLIRDGRIAAIGKQVSAPTDAERIDVSGKRIYPGLISAESRLGLAEFGNLPPSQDTAEIGENNAHLKVELAVEPETDHWPVARSGGVLSALIVPEVRAGGLFAGQSALMKPQGWTYEQMTVAGGVGVHLYWPSDSSLRQRLTQLMEEARLFSKAEHNRASASVPRLAALVAVLERHMPLFIHAARIRDIHEALAFAKQEQLHAVLVSGPEAWRAADEIVKQNVAVILTPGSVRRWEGFETSQSAAGKLVAAGAKVAISNCCGPSAAVRLPSVAGTYAAYGLGDEAALRAITLTPAEVLGVADRLGSLDSGKAATLFVTNGDILLATTAVERIWIDGRPIDAQDNHHDRLYRKYQKKYQGQSKE